jgi:hypothetical protein
LKTESGALCGRPHPSAPLRPPHRATPRHTQTLTTGSPSLPDPSVSHVDRVAPTPPLSTVVRQRAARARRGRVAAAPTPCHRAAPRCAKPPSLSLALSRSASTRSPPFRPPTPPLLVKMEPPSAENFSQPTRRHLVRPRLSIAHSSPSSRHPPHRFSSAGLRPSVAAIRPLR